MKKITLSIAIPAYNEEGNIGPLLKSLSSQRRENFRLKEIVVLSDGSTDMTNEIVRLEAKKNRKIYLKSGKRIGKSRRISHFLAACKSDVVLFLDADIEVEDRLLLSKVARAFSKNMKLGLVGLCDIPKNTKGFIPKSINELVYTWNDMKEKVNGGLSIHNIHGCAYAMSKDLYKYVNIPKTVFNDDEYAYILNDKASLEFSHLCRARVYYSTPKTMSDYIRQSARFSEARERTIHYFGEGARSYFAVPKLLKYKTMLNHLALHSLYFVGATMLQVQYGMRKKNIKENFNSGYWNIINSTKAPSTNV